VQSKTRRRDERFRVQIPIRLKQGARILELVTENVSYRGLFVCTDSPPPLRQLVRIEALLPPEDVRFVSHGMSVFVVAPAEATDHPAGAGLQFYGMGDERRSWEKFVNHIKVRALAERAAAAKAAEDAGNVPMPEPPRRQHERMPVVLEVRPRDVDELARMFTRDVSAGGMFLSTNQRVAIGTDLSLAVKHPATGDMFAVDAVVRRHSSEPAGIGVELVAMTESKRRAFYEFIYSTLPPAESDDFSLADFD
jgi:Tfp pilus assembly protein PilZ